MNEIKHDLELLSPQQYDQLLSFVKREEARTLQGQRETIKHFELKRKEIRSYLEGNDVETYNRLSYQLAAQETKELAATTSKLTYLSEVKKLLEQKKSNNASNSVDKCSYSISPAKKTN